MEIVERNIVDRMSAPSMSERYPTPEHDPLAPKSMETIDTRINILLVDDEPKNLVALSTILEDTGYQLVMAQTADEALLALIREEFALIILDIQMPGMTGFELAHMIKQRKKTATVPIIFLTAYYSEDEHVLEGYETGAVDYLQKPVNTPILRSKVAVFAELHRKTQESNRANQALLEEVAERRRIEEQLVLLNLQLEDRVDKRTSELRRANAATRQSEQWLRLAQQAGKVGIWEWNIREDHGTWTDYTWELFGLTVGSEKITYTRWLSCVHPEDRDRVAKAMDDAKLTGEYKDEYRLIVDQNNVKWVESTGAVEFESNQPVWIRGAIRDITERKQIELELKAADRRKDEFLAILAHELRNPLAPIRNALHIMQLSGDDKKTFSDFRELMERQLVQMVHLVDDLLDVSRISRGKIQLRMEPVEITKIVENAIEISSPLIKLADHQLSVDTGRETIYVQGDATRLAQVLSNILNNSAKYTPDGGRIYLTVVRNEHEVTVAIRDNGIGIAPSVLPNLFEMFMQFDQSANRGQGGLGIGLALVRRLVELHGGRVAARSQGEGQGSEFEVSLPILKTETKTIDGEELEEMSESEPISKERRVLVVDDNRDSADSLAIMLQMMGNRVETAYDGPAALEKAVTFKPSVVLLDIGMPGMNGHEVASRMRQMPEVHKAVLIAQTGWGKDNDRKLSRAAGFDHHLVKPIDPNLLESLFAKLETDHSGFQ